MMDDWVIKTIAAIIIILVGSILFFAMSKDSKEIESFKKSCESKNMTFYERDWNVYKCITPEGDVKYFSGVEE